MAVRRGYGMASEQRYEQACAVAEAVLAALAAYRLLPTPENYRIWHVHLCGEDPALSRMLRSLQDSGEPIDEARCAEIYERFFVRAAEERALLRAGQRL